MFRLLVGGEALLEFGDEGMKAAPLRTFENHAEQIRFPFVSLGPRRNLHVGKLLSV
jgi:hypothetical protein